MDEGLNVLWISLKETALLSGVFLDGTLDLGDQVTTLAMEAFV